MKPRFTTSRFTPFARLSRPVAAGALLACTTATWAHEGHGMAAASHWHASDTFGLLLVAGLAALALWFSGGKK